jgi:predicted DNA-binding transcriptional regulator YafY
MSQAERISRIHFLIRAKGVVSLKELKQTFDVSRATLMRDIELMRDRLGAPLTYDAKENGYRYDEACLGDRVDELPGLWLSAHEAYAFLTMFNVLREIDPGFLMYFVDPMRKTLKHLLGSQNFAMQQLDRKVVIDLPNFLKTAGAHLAPVFTALVNDEVVRLRWKNAAAEECESECAVIRLTLRETGWKLSIQPTGASVVTVPLENILRSGRAASS